MHDTITKRAQFFKDEERIVHIVKKDSRFLNGIIKEVSSDFLILIDEKLGEMPVFFLEIITIEPRKPIKKEGEDGNRC